MHHCYIGLQRHRIALFHTEGSQCFFGAICGSGPITSLTRRTRGHRLSDFVQELKTALTGGVAYFGIAEVLSPLREIDKWVRRRLRCCAWKQWGSAGYRDTSETRGHAGTKPGTPARARTGHGG